MSELGQSLIAGLNEALAHARGEHGPGLRIHVIDVPVADDTNAPPVPDSGDASEVRPPSGRPDRR